MEGFRSIGLSSIKRVLGWLLCKRLVALASQSCVRFPTAVLPFVSVFVWGVVVGIAISRKPPTKFESIVNKASERAKEIIQEQSEASSQDRVARNGLPNSD